MRARGHGRIAGHHATDGYEPRQVREEAAVSIAVCVMVDSSLTDRGNDLNVVTGSMVGARPGIFFHYNTYTGIWPDISCVKQGAIYSSLVKQIEKEASKCARCGACQSVCPIFPLTKREQEVARGKVALADAFVRNELKRTGHLDRIIRNCLLCLACKENCPNHVDTELIIKNMRAILGGVSGIGRLGENVFGRIFRNSELLRASLKIDAVFFSLGMDRIVPESSGIRIRFPYSLLFEERFPVARVPLKKRIRENEGAAGAEKRCLFFVGCTTQYIKPRIGVAAVDILVLLGYNVITPEEQGCCGFAASAGGDLETANLLKKRFLELLSRYSVDFIVTVCPTCNRRIQDIIEITGYDTPVYDISKFIVELFERKLAQKVPDNKAVVTYHESCHLSRGLGIREEPRIVLKEYFGRGFREMDKADTCCGLGGLYGVTHPDISAEILDRKMEAVEKTACRYVFTSCPACVLQLEAGARRKKLDVQVMHLAQIVHF